MTAPDADPDIGAGADSGPAAGRLRALPVPAAARRTAAALRRRVLAALLLGALAAWGHAYFVGRHEVLLSDAVVRADPQVLRAPLEAPVVNVHVVAGDTVAAGALLVELESSVYRGYVAAVQARLDAAPAEQAGLRRALDAQQREIGVRRTVQADAAHSAAQCADRLDRLKAARAVSAAARTAAQQAWESAYAQVQTAAAASAAAEQRLQDLQAALTATQAHEQADRAELQQARAALEATRIRAPEAGVVAAVAVRAGDIVAAYAPLLTLMPTATYVAAYADATQRPRLQPGAVARLRFEAFPAQTVYGQITAVSAQGEVRIMPNPSGRWHGRLLPGMRARVKVDVAPPAAVRGSLSQQAPATAPES